METHVLHPRQVTQSFCVSLVLLITTFSGFNWLLKRVLAVIKGFITLTFYFV